MSRHSEKGDFRALDLIGLIFSQYTLYYNGHNRFIIFKNLLIKRNNANANNLSKILPFI